MAANLRELADRLAEAADLLDKTADLRNELALVKGARERLQTELTQTQLRLVYSQQDVERLARERMTANNEVITLKERLESARRLDLSNSEHWVAKAMFNEVQRDAAHWKKNYDALESTCKRLEADLATCRQARFDFEQSNKKMKAQLDNVAKALAQDGPSYCASHHVNPEG